MRAITGPRGALCGNFHQSGACVCLYKKRREIFTARACEKHELVVAVNYTFTRRNNRVRAAARRTPSHCPDYFASLRESRVHLASMEKTTRPFLPLFF